MLCLPASSRLHAQGAPIPAAERAVVVGSDRDYPPFEFEDAEGRPEGFNVDLLRAVGEVMGWKVYFRIGPWRQIRDDFEQHRGIDITDMFDLPVRREKADLSRPFLELFHQVYTRRGAPEVRTLAQLAGRTVSVESGAAADDLLAKEVPGARLLPVPSDADALRALAAGRCDAAVVGQIGARSSLKRYHLDNLVPTGGPVLPLAYCYAIPKSNPELMSQLNQGLEILRANGAYDRIYERWLGAGAEGPDVKAIAFWSAAILLPLVLLAAAAAAWSLSLRRKVAQRTAELQRELLARSEAEARVRSLNRMYAVLSETNQALVRGKEPQAMLESACRIAVERGGFRMAWAGLIDESTGRLKPLTSSGHVDGYLDKLNIRLGAGEPGPTVAAIRLGGHRAVNDISQDPSMAPWREEALKRGYRSCAAFALKISGRSVGAINFYADDVAFFDGEELALLDELAMDISFAMEVARGEETRRRAEEAHAHLSAAVEQAGESIMITDAAGTIVYVNPAFERITGFSRAEAVGANPRLVKSGRHDAAFYQAMWKSLLDGAIWTGRFTNRRKNGEIYEEETTISPIRNEDGRIVHYVAVKKDVTQEAALESQLRQAQKMEALGQLSGGVAHDFNNILSVVHGNATLLLEGVSQEEAADCARQIVQASERAASLTRQLLLFSRKQVLQPSELSLNQVVEGVLKMLKRVLGEDIALATELGSGLPPLSADPGMLEQVILNLAVNARDAMPEGGRLEIGTAFENVEAAPEPGTAPGPYLRLDVADTGTGIPPEIMPRIFDPFFTTKEVGKGTGLGLATVHGIARQHKGWVRVVSRPGQGTRFSVYLPALQRSPAAQSRQVASASPAKGTETVLLAEDEASLKALVVRALERSGYTVLAASSGLEALDVWAREKSRIDILLTDLVMPDGVSGFDLARRLTQDKPALKVLFTSGYQAMAGKGPELVEGENFLQKPYTISALARAVRNCLDGASPSFGATQTPDV